MLLDSVDEISANVTKDSYALINVKLKPPWHLLANASENLTQILDMLDAHVLSSQQLLSRGFAAEEELRKKVRNSINKVKFFVFSFNFSLNLFEVVIYFLHSMCCVDKKDWKTNSKSQRVN